MIPIEKICPTCGNAFLPNGNNQKYCSPACARHTETAKRISYIRGRQKDRQKIDKNLLNAYHCECAICHWSIPEWMDCYKKKETMHGLNFHHIVSVMDGGNSENENVILLCPNCHKMAHAGIIPESVLREHTITPKDAERLAEEYELKIAKERAELIEKKLNRQAI